jgi:hypothetical protein
MPIKVPRTLVAGVLEGLLKSAFPSVRLLPTNGEGFTTPSFAVHEP